MNLPAAGYLTIADQLLYKVNPSKSVQISLISCVNEDVSAQTINIWIKILNVNLEIALTALNTSVPIDTPFTYNVFFDLQANCEIWGNAAVDNKVNFLIFGREL